MVVDSEVRVIESPNRVRYALPLRRLGPIRWLGVVPIALGLALMYFGCHWIITAFDYPHQPRGDVSWTSFFFAAFGLPFIVAGLMPVAIGMGLFIGRSRIELADGKLRNVEFAWPFRRTWCKPVGEVRGFSVGGGLNPIDPSREGATHWPGPFRDRFAIKAECKQGRPLILAPGYPRPMLESIAADLASRVGTEQIDRPATHEAPKDV